MLPFTREQFLAVFAQYNAAIWPAQIVAVLLGVAVAATLWRAPALGARWIDATLALLWLWTGGVYHGIFFARINPAALAFAALFVMQGLLFGWRASTGRGAQGVAAGPAAALGWALILYAGLLYPVAASLSGHAYPAMPTFGVTPCPLVLFTFGALLIGPQPVPRTVLVIPALWSLVGGSAAYLLDIAPDWPLLIGGLAATAMLWPRASRVLAAAV